MSILSVIRSWTTEIGVYHSGSLYREENFPLYWLVRKVLSKVVISDPTAEGLKSLSEKGVVVYALKNKSQLNSLILHELSMRKGIPRPAYCHGINMITWQPFPMALRVILSHLFHRILRKTAVHSTGMDHLKQRTLEGKTSIIHLGESELFENPFVEETLSQLLDAQESSAVPIYLCPELITYGRRREREEESLINIFFGQSDTTDPVRRVITFLRYSNKASVISAEPINLEEYLKAGEALTRDEIIRQLRGDLIARIDEEKTTIVGPLLKSREEIIGMVLRDKGLVSFMEETASKAKKGKRDLAAVRKEARKYLEEIASDYNEIFVEIWAKILSWTVRESQRSGRYPRRCRLSSSPAIGVISIIFCFPTASTKTTSRCRSWRPGPTCPSFPWVTSSGNRGPSFCGGVSRETNSTPRSLPGTSRFF
jgi:glycerol-3-phosphate O-acyltransferase